MEMQVSDDYLEIKKKKNNKRTPALHTPPKQLAFWMGQWTSTVLYYHLTPK